MSRYKFRFPFSLVLILLAAMTVRAQTPFTLEQVLSSPFPTGLAAAEHGSRVAWVFDAKGVRNVWVADGPDFAHTARQVTHYNQDDGQPIASLRLTPDGKTALYALGSELNGAQESANPASWRREPSSRSLRSISTSKTQSLVCSAIWAVPTKVAKTSRFRLTANGQCGRQKRSFGSAVSTANSRPRNWRLCVEQQTNPSGRPMANSSLSSVNAIPTALCPFMNSIATRFAISRPALTRTTCRDGRPTANGLCSYAPQERKQKQPLIPVRPEPWSIRIADTATGQVHVLWRSGTKLDDSLPQLTEDASLNVAADGRVIFASEQDGRNHLYSIPASGGAATLLTPGDFDVEDVTLSADKVSVIYSSNQDDVDRRHLWRVSAAGGAPPQALTHGETMEWSPVQTGDGKNILCLGSTATVPAMPYVVTAGGREMIAKQALPSDFPSASLVTPKQVIFKSADGLTLHGQLFVPRNVTGKAPGLIFTHGGPIRQMMLGFHYMDYYHNAYAMNQYLASQGYVVLSVNYRLGVMYGRAFREAPNSVWRGAAEYQDVVAGGKYLQSLPEVDGAKLGLWGGSYGGFLTAMGLARNSDMFKAGVDFHGVHDWSVFLTERPYFGNLATRPPDADAAVKLAWESSPDAYVSTWKSPVLLIHGDDDRNVPFSQTVDLAQRLRTQNVSFEQLVLPDEIHGFLMWKDWVRAYTATADFFDRTLKRGEKIGTGD